jgi:hypothetical protein
MLEHSPAVGKQLHRIAGKNSAAALATCFNTFTLWQVKITWGAEGEFVQRDGIGKIVLKVRTCTPGDKHGCYSISAIRYGKLGILHGDYDRAKEDYDGAKED